MQDSNAFMDALNTASEAVTIKRSVVKPKPKASDSIGTTSSNLINKITDSVNLTHNNLVVARVNFFDTYNLNAEHRIYLNLNLKCVINEKHSNRTYINCIHDDIVNTTYLKCPLYLINMNYFYTTIDIASFFLNSEIIL